MAQAVSSADNGRLPARATAAEHPRPHILALPFPAIGHIKPVLQVCKFLIAKAGCRVTVACCEMSMPLLHQLLPTTPDHMALLPLSNPVRLDVSGGPPTWDTYRTVLRSYYEALPRSFAGHMAGLSDVVCVISDVYLTWAAEVADQLRVPHLAQWISCAAELQVYLHAKELLQGGKLPFKAPPSSEKNGFDNLVPSLGGNLPQYHQVHGKVEGEEEIKLPGLPSLMRRDFPALLQIEDTSDVLFSLFVEHVKCSFTASMVLFNSFEALEGRVLDVMRSQGIVARSIGPLFLTEDAFVIEKGPSKEEQECLKWLDGQKPKSVLYVAFGTVVRLDSAQVKELAFGLLNSGQPFIWVFPNSEDSDSSKRMERLPEAFLDQVKDQALLLEWAPQTCILSHPSTGGFLTHCGWNSTMETLCHGVPTLCFPFAGDQFLNCKMVVDEWKVGLRLERRGHGGIALAGDIERLTQELFHEEKGNAVQKRAHELKLAAHDALQIGGSSRLALETILELLK